MFGSLASVPGVRAPFCHVLEKVTGLVPELFFKKKMNLGPELWFHMDTLIRKICWNNWLIPIYKMLFDLWNCCYIVLKTKVYIDISAYKDVAEKLLHALHAHANCHISWSRCNSIDTCLTHWNSQFFYLIHMHYNCTTPGRNKWEIYVNPVTFRFAHILSDKIQVFQKFKYVETQLKFYNLIPYELKILMVFSGREELFQQSSMVCAMVPFLAWYIDLGNFAPPCRKVMAPPLVGRIDGGGVYRGSAVRRWACLWAWTL